MKIATVNAGVTRFDVTWSDGSHSAMPYIWLRDNDLSELHPDTQERTFDLTSVSLDIKPEHHHYGDTELLVQWPGRSQASSYSAKWLHDHRLDRKRPDPSVVAAKPWVGHQMSDIPRFASQECWDNSTALLEMLVELKRTGLVIVDGLPDRFDAGEDFGDLIGFKRESNFGVMFEVINKPDPNNLAYTALALPLHTDLPNQELIPGYQFLHCIKSTATGGESIFADGFQICRDLKHDHPELYDQLCATPIPWRFHDAGCDLIQHWPVIKTNANGEQTAFIFNAHLAGVLDLPANQVESYYVAFQTVMNTVRDAKYATHYLLKPGEMAVFDNRRVLHGRAQFDPQSGQRHLRGYYIEHNEVNSTMRVLNRH